MPHSRASHAVDFPLSVGYDTEGILWIIPPVYGLRLISVESRGIERARFRAITIWPVVSLFDN